MSSIRVDFSGKVIAVTGAFGALGSAACAKLAGFGAQVARLDHAPAPTAIGDVIAFLLSDSAGAVTGALIPVSGRT